jgi:hypothetical protein
VTATVQQLLLGNVVLSAGWLASELRHADLHDGGGGEGGGGATFPLIFHAGHQALKKLQNEIFRSRFFVTNQHLIGP